MSDPLQALTESLFAKRRIEIENAGRLRRGKPPLSPAEEDRIQGLHSLPDLGKAVIIQMPYDYDDLIDQIEDELDLRRALNKCSSVYTAYYPSDNPNDIGKKVPGFFAEKKEGKLWAKLKAKGFTPIWCDGISFDPFYFRDGPYYGEDEIIEPIINRFRREAAEPDGYKRDPNTGTSEPYWNPLTQA